jgi:CheY-like chemotaxis protein/CheY-specific phosphatase CheX
MRILLVDDSLTIRSLMRRTLADLAQAEIAEAANGVEALAQLARRRFDLVVLDINMPIMDGVETLEAIRATPEYAALPVVVLTSEKNEPLVRRLVELGITAYLSKPLSQDLLSDRLSKILSRLREPAPAQPRAQANARRVLVVEQDPDRRHFLLNALAGRYEALEADSGAAALQACLATPAPALDLVLIGQGVGLPPVEMLVPKLRDLPNLAGLQLIGCVAKGETVPDRRRRLFDGLIETGCVPEVFLADLERVVTGTQTALMRVLLVRPTLARDVVGATEQVFGMMLSCEIEASTDPRHGHRWSEPGIFASIGLLIDGVPALNLLFGADARSARAISGRMIGVQPAEVQDADVLATAAELSNIVLGRVRNRLLEAGLQAQVDLPRTWSGQPPAHDDPHAIDVRFDSPALDASFGFLLEAPSPK